MDEPAAGLRVPPAEPATFDRNLISAATCELRFPILLDVQNRPPSKLASALRKEYPHFDRRSNVNVGPGAGPVETENVYVFNARGGRWSVTFKASAIALGTTQYTGFTEFADRLADVLNATAPVIDSDFFTRVGLRYINVVPADQGELDGWVNSALVGPLVEGVYGRVEVFNQEVRGRAGAGSFSLRHGLGESKQPGKTQYVLDFDFFKEDVPAKETLELLERLHDECFSLFLWTLDSKAVEYLGERKPKPARERTRR